MATRRVLLGGTGTSGDGSTWNDDSSGTAAYIGVTGLDAAIDASSAGDTVLVQGSKSTAGSVTISGPVGNPTTALDPILVIGVTSASDTAYVPGLRTGDTDEAWNDVNCPTVTVTGVNNAIILTGNLYIYGIKFVTSERFSIATNDNSLVLTCDECQFQMTAAGGSDFFDIADFRAGPEVNFINCDIQTDVNNINATIGNRVTFLGGQFDSLLSGGVTPSDNASLQFIGVDFTGFASGSIVDVDFACGALILFSRCKFPTGVSLVDTGTPDGPYEVMAVDCDDATGVTTSILLSEKVTSFGQVITETTKVRTGGATDGEAGSWSFAMNPVTGLTVPESNRASVRTPPLSIWIDGDGTSQTVTVYFASDSANTNSADWQDDKVWAEVRFPSAAGDAQADFVSSKVDLGGTPVNVGDDTVSTWASGTQNPQKIDLSIAPDYAGWVLVEVAFAPGDADTIYVDPRLVIS